MSAFVPPDGAAPLVTPPVEGRARRARDRTRRGADAVVATLADAGITHAFGLPGGAISPFVDALMDEPRIRSILLRHEATCVFAAYGYAMQSQTVGIVFVTSGPGATNAITGIASAFCDGVPLVVLIGEVPRASQGRGALQDGSSHNLNIAGMLRHITKATWEATDAHVMPHMIERALRLASSGRKGPVAVLLPLDAQLAMTIESRSAAFSAENLAIDDATMNDIAARISKATRPALFVGNGCRDPHTAAALVAFAQHSGIPVITTPKAKGVFPESHPLCLGVFGIGGHASARHLFEQQVDCLIAVGTRFGDIATDGWNRALYPTRALIHVDIDGASLACNYAADVALVAPAQLFFTQLTSRLAPHAQQSSYTGIESLRAAPIDDDDKQQGYNSPAAVMSQLQQSLPSDTVYTVDSGEHTLAALHWLRIEHADGFLVATGLGSMGGSTGLAIGASLAHPQRRVCAIIGDAGFLMVGMDVADAVALQLNITFVVMNDGTMNMCERGHQRVYKRTPTFAVPPLSYPHVAAAVGTTLVALGAAPAPGPCLVEARYRPGALDFQERDRMLQLVKRQP